MSIEVIRYRLPVYWACALINDDYSGLSEEEGQVFCDMITERIEKYEQREPYNP